MYRLNVFYYPLLSSLHSSPLSHDIISFLVGHPKFDAGIYFEYDEGRADEDHNKTLTCGRFGQGRQRLCPKHWRQIIAFFCNNLGHDGHPLTLRQAHLSGLSNGCTGFSVYGHMKLCYATSLTLCV
jgi:hypothetical protein